MVVILGLKRCKDSNIMSNNGSMWKRLIRKTIGKREEKVHKDDDVVFVNFEVDRKGIIRTLIDDHRDAALYRHTLCAIYLKLMGMSSGATPHYEDKTGFVRPILKEIKRLRKRIEELETTVKEYEEKGVCIR